MKDLICSLATILSVSRLIHCETECGVSPLPDEQLTEKIVGGKVSSRGQWPWQVSLWRISNGEPAYHFCGGTIINENWIMTAAHCLGQEPEDILIRANEYNLTGDDPGQIDRYVEKVFMHPDWSWHSGDNDVGLVKLNTTLDYKENKLRPVCLPRKGKDFDKKKCLSIGWGLLEYKGDMPELLQEVEMPIVSQNLCKRSYQRIRDVTKNMICAGHMGGSKGVCHGDSGGPLQCRSNDGRWYEVGITSWGLGCAWEKFPGVFARVDQYTKWIDQTISRN